MELYVDGVYDPWKNNKIPIKEHYATAAFIRYFQKGKPLGKINDDFPRYMNYTFNVYNPIEYQLKVLKNGYIEKAPEIFSLSILTIPALKDILRNAKLPLKGKKADLIQRIQDNLDISQLKLEQLYIPSAKGTEHFKRYEYVFSLPNYNISIDEYDSYEKLVQDDISPNDRIRKILNERFNRANLSSNYEYAGNIKCNIHKLLYSENKYEDALYNLISALYYDTYRTEKEAFIENFGEEMLEDEFWNEELQEEELLDTIEFNLWMVSDLQKLKDYYDSKMVDNCYTSYNLPNHHLSKEQFSNLLSYIFEGTVIKICNLHPRHKTLLLDKEKL